MATQQSAPAQTSPASQSTQSSSPTQDASRSATSSTTTDPSNQAALESAGLSSTPPDDGPLCGDCAELILGALPLDEALSLIEPYLADPTIVSGVLIWASTLKTGDCGPLIAWASRIARDRIWPVGLGIEGVARVGGGVAFKAWKDLSASILRTGEEELCFTTVGTLRVSLSEGPGYRALDGNGRGTGAAAGVDISATASLGAKATATGICAEYMWEAGIDAVEIFQALFSEDGPLALKHAQALLANMKSAIDSLEKEYTVCAGAAIIAAANVDVAFDTGPEVSAESDGEVEDPSNWLTGELIAWVGDQAELVFTALRPYFLPDPGKSLKEGGEAAGLAAAEGAATYQGTNEIVANKDGKTARITRSISDFIDGVGAEYRLGDGLPKDAQGLIEIIASRVGWEAKVMATIQIEPEPIQLKSVAFAFTTAALGETDTTTLEFPSLDAAAEWAKQGVGDAIEEVDDAVDTVKDQLGVEGTEEADAATPAPAEMGPRPTLTREASAAIDGARIAEEIPWIWEKILGLVEEQVASRADTPNLVVDARFQASATFSAPTWEAAAQAGLPDSVGSHEAAEHMIAVGMGESGLDHQAALEAGWSAASHSANLLGRVTQASGGSTSSSLGDYGNSTQISLTLNLPLSGDELKAAHGLLVA
jgi:hypothetical protein